MKIEIDPTIRKWPSDVNSETKPALRLTELDDTNLTHQGGQQKLPLIKDIVGNQVCKFGGLHLDPRLSKKDCWFNNSSVSLLFISDMISFFSALRLDQSSFCETVIPPLGSLTCPSQVSLQQSSFEPWGLSKLSGMSFCCQERLSKSAYLKKKHASILYNIWWHIIIII